MRRQDNSLVCETVEARSAKSREDIRTRAAGEADVSETEVVGQDEDDVRPRASKRGDWSDGQCRSDCNNSKCLFHDIIIPQHPLPCNCEIFVLM